MIWNLRLNFFFFFPSGKSLASYLWKFLSVPVAVLPGSVMAGPLGAEMPVPALLSPIQLLAVHFTATRCKCISRQRASSCDRSMRGERETDRKLACEKLDCLFVN